MVLIAINTKNLCLSIEGAHDGVSLLYASMLEQRPPLTISCSMF